jgi:hypothetical protein
MGGKIHKRTHYPRSSAYKIKRGFTFFLIAYLVLSALPFSPGPLSSTELVSTSTYAYNWGRFAVDIRTNAGHDYEITGQGADPRAFQQGDTLTVFRNILLKTRSVYHHRTTSLFTFERFGSTLFLILVSILLIILTLSKDHRVENAFNIVCGVALALFVVYLCN